MSIASAITSCTSIINEHRRVRILRAGLLGLTILSFLVARPGRADEVEAHDPLSQLRARVAELETSEGAANAQGALDQARRAIRVAADPTVDVPVASRARQIARAAVVLASRQIDRSRAQQEILSAQQRLEEIRDRAEAQRRVLDALLRERALLARAEESP